MKFCVNELSALAVYVPDEDATEWYTTGKEWVDAGQTVDVNFETVIEPVFAFDLLSGTFSPIDEEAFKYTNQVFQNHTDEFYPEQRMAA
jgi:hypothetical protein